MLDGRTLALVINYCTARLALRFFLPAVRRAANDNPRRGHGQK